jgi:hypothetical protein
MIEDARIEQAMPTALCTERGEAHRELGWRINLMRQPWRFSRGGSWREILRVEGYWQRFSGKVPIGVPIGGGQ